MTAEPSPAAAILASLRALADDAPASALPDMGALAALHSGDTPGGLAIGSWLFRRRLRAFGAGEDMAPYRSPFAPAPVED